MSDHVDVPDARFMTDGCGHVPTYRTLAPQIPDRAPTRPPQLVLPLRLCVWAIGAVAVVVGFLWGLLR